MWGKLRFSVDKSNRISRKKIADMQFEREKVEPSRVELLSRLDIDFLLIHRFSSCYPKNGDYQLSLIVGCFSKVFTQLAN